MNSPSTAGRNEPTRTIRTATPLYRRGCTRQGSRQPWDALQRSRHAPTFRPWEDFTEAVSTIQSETVVGISLRCATSRGAAQAK